MRTKCIYLLSILTVFVLINCASTPDTPKTARSKTKETQQDKFWRLYNNDNGKLIVGSDKMVTIESLEAVFKPVIITSCADANSLLAKSEPGIPRYFKLQALYKGFLAEPSQYIFLQTMIEKNVFNSVHNWVVGYFKGLESSFPSKVNCNATFYIVGGRFTEPNDEIGIWVRAVRNIEEPLYEPSKFIIANDRRFITLGDVRLPSAGNDGIYAESVFDPDAYPVFNLFDARIAMDKKNWGDSNTFPMNHIKYVSEVIFKGQSGTTIFVSTEDNFLTERMSFYGRTGSIKAGDKIRVFYTIHKDPIERWEVHALEIME
jgi:hypothetical protein